MTLLQLSRKYCANHQPDGSCLGIMIDDKLNMSLAQAKPACSLKTPGVRCRYFEECVMPQKFEAEPPLVRESIADEIKAYRRSAIIPSTAIPLTKVYGSRQCPDCGEPLLLRHRYCEICGKRHLRESNRRSIKEKRGLCVHLTKKAPLNTNDLQG